MKVLILTDPKGSGKTTLLQQWSEKNEAGGILTPVEDGKRYFYAVNSGLAWPMEADDTEQDVLVVGKYRFSTTGFAQAAITLAHDFRAGNFPLIIDEIGPLELDGKGLDGVVSKMAASPMEASLIVVVREGLADEVIARYFSGAEVRTCKRDSFKEKARCL